MQKNNFKHIHPISIFKYLRKLIIILVIPLARGLLKALINGSLYSWAKGSYFDIIVLVLIMATAILAWHEQIFYFDNTGLYIKRGLLRRNTFFISNQKIATLMFLEPFHLRVFKAVRLVGSTNAGMAQSTDFDIIIFKKDAQKLLNIRNKSELDLDKANSDKLYNIGSYDESKIGTRVYKPRSFYIAIFSAVLSNSLAGVIIVYTFLTQAGDILGDEFERRFIETFSYISQILANNLPQVFTSVALVIVGGWVIAFIQNLFRYLYFSVSRTEKFINIKGGITSKRNYLMLVDKINYIDIRQSVLTKIFKLEITFIACTGYGKDKNALPVLIPASIKNDSIATLKLLLPENSISEREIKPKYLRSVFAYITFPLVIVLITYVSAYFMYYVLPDWSELIYLISIVLSIPFLWIFITKVLDFSTTGIGENDNSYSLYYSSFFYLHKIILPKNKVTKIIIKQNPFQKKSDLCTVIIHSFAEKRKRHIIRSLDKSECIKFFNQNI